ncbi:MAG: hypothetical protein DRN90_05210 [Thermoproteota archaeon]|nr:MAG: hypothetical protein DRN90_05210 [Candidatus Korarchaeota archaeon]
MYLKINSDRLRDLLLEIISIKSFFSREVELADFLISELAKIADKVERQPVEGCGGNVIAYVGSEDKPLKYLLMCHMDTVELFEGWSRNPWGEVDGDIVYGIGAFDSKSSLAAMIEALRVVSDVKDELKGRIILAAVCDEEGYSRGTYQLAKSGKLKGVELGVVGEPTQMKIMKGAYGRLVFDITVKGRAAVGTERRGINAVVEACKLVLWAVKYSSKPKVKGSVAPLAIRSQEFIVTHPERCLIRMDRHYPSGSDEEEKRRFVSYLKKAPDFRANTEIRLMQRPTPYAAPYQVPENSPAFLSLKKAYIEVLGREPEVELYHTVSDANYLHQIGNISLPILGPRGGNQHSRDEYVLFDSVQDLCKVYLKAITSTLLE